MSVTDRRKLVARSTTYSPLSGGQRLLSQHLHNAPGTACIPSAFVSFNQPLERSVRRPVLLARVSVTRCGGAWASCRPYQQLMV